MSAVNDGDVVRLARKIDDHLDAIRHLIEEVELSGHTHASNAAYDLMNQCHQPAWASHVIHKHLYDPSRWETGDFGIRHKAATKAVSARS